MFESSHALLQVDPHFIKLTYERLVVPLPLSAR